MNYGTLINGTLHPAPRAVRIGGAVMCNPTDAQYEAAGYKRVVDTPPQTDAAHYAVPIGWAEHGGEIVRQYEVREVPPPPPRRWTRLAIKTALAQAGILSQALAYLAQVEGTDIVHRGRIPRRDALGRAPRRGRERAWQEPCRD